MTRVHQMNVDVMMGRTVVVGTGGDESLHGRVRTMSSFCPRSALDQSTTSVSYSAPLSGKVVFT